MRLFILKISAVVMFILSVLVLEDTLMGTMPFLAGLLLLGLCGFATITLFRASTKKARRRTRARTSGARAPQLRVVHGSRTPGGPRVA